jgi:hypothetical protein
VLGGVDTEKICMSRVFHFATLGHLWPQPEEGLQEPVVAFGGYDDGQARFVCVCVCECARLMFSVSLLLSGCV